MVLFALVAAILLIGVLYLGGLPMLRNRRAQKEELADLNQKIERANKVIDRKEELRAVLQAKTETLDAIHARMIPPSNNTFVWATEQLATYCRQNGVEIEAINEVAVSTPSWDKPPEAGKPPPAKRRYFAPYQVKIDFNCAYHQLKNLLKTIEADNRFASVASLSVAANDATPEKHRISMILEWPVVKKTAKKSIARILAHGLLEQEEEKQ